MTGRSITNLSPENRRLAAVMLADVVGYSHLMSVDEAGTHKLVTRFLAELLDPVLAEHGGCVIKNSGDGVLAVFGSALGAVKCSLDIQQRLRERQQCQISPIQLRIGINTGDIIFDDRDIYGHSINVTARLECLASPGSVCVSQSIHDQTRTQPGLRFLDRGAHRVKNIDFPLRVFEVSYGPSATIRRHAPRYKYAGAIACVAIALLTTGYYVCERSYSGDIPKNSILVLPFRNLSSNAEDEYFADAITDDVTTDLSRLSGAFVIASATALTYKGHPADVRIIGKNCGVKYLLQGTLRRVDRKLLINIQLIDASTGGNVWADRFIYEAATLQELEEAITGRVGTSLKVQPVIYKTRPETGSLAADHNPMDERFRAMALILGEPTPEKYLEARRDVEACLIQDSGSSKCLALLARILMSDYLNSWNGAGPPDVDRAELAYKRALELDPENSVAYYAGGFVRRVRGDHEGALANFEKAVELDHNFAAAYGQAANEFVFLGKIQEAIEAGKKAALLSPQDPAIGVFNWIIGRAYFTNGQYDEAVVWLTKSVEKRPNLWFNRAWLVSARALSRQKEDGHLREFVKIFPTYTLAHIKEIYCKEKQYDNETLKAAREHLFEGLEKAGLS